MPKAKSEWRWRECAWGGPAKLRLIVIAEGLAMVRHKGCAAFVITEKEWLAMKPVTVWPGPYLVRLKRQVGDVPAGSVGTVVEHYADGKAAEVEFYCRDVFCDEHDHYVETVEFEDMEDAENGR